MQRLVNTSRPKVLLLDVDGVVFTHKKTLDHVSHNIVQYCAKELKVSSNQALSINKLLYTEYGHSYRGLRKMYNIDKSIDHFNTCVYTHDVLQSVESSDHDMLQHLNFMQLKQMVLRCQCEGVPVYLFTNAPLQWCRSVLKVSGLGRYIPEEHVLSCDHDVMTFHEDDGFKPVDAVYDTAQKFIENMHYLDDPIFIFMEDSFKNLVPVIGKSSWFPIYMDAKMNIPFQDRVSVVHTAKEAKELLSKVMHITNK